MARDMGDTGNTGNTGRLPRFITNVVGTAAGLFYQVDQHGPPIPEEGPVLVTANHPNSLLDPLLVFRCSGRTTRPLAKAPLFEQLLLGTVLRALGGIPVYRRQDNPDVMHKNDEMFSAAVQALTDGGAIQIYPEGKSHSEPGLAEFRTGAARIAIAAEEAMDWRLGLSVVPVGITYLRKDRARTPVVVRFGEPFAFVDLKQAYDSDPAEAVRILTDRIEAGIRKQTLNFVHPDDKTLVDVAERLYVRQSGWVPWRAREGLGTRFPRLQRFAEGLEWIRREAPEEHDALRRKVDRYHALHTLVGAGEGEVPPQYGLMPVAKYIVVRGTLLVLGLPVALLGGLLWGLLPLAPRAAVRVARPEFEATATYKLVGLMFGGVLLWLLWMILAWRWGGAWTGLAAAVLAPLLGYLAVQWLELLGQVREDATLFLRLQGRPDIRDRFARQRGELIAAFQRVEERLLSQAAADNVSASPGG
ncbi:MAG: 1-acyl-sn-glycerol-3-phosphate acyltransferase [Longimicrobiales bacterium]